MATGAADIGTSLERSGFCEFIDSFMNSRNRALGFNFRVCLYPAELKTPVTSVSYNWHLVCFFKQKLIKADSALRRCTIQRVIFI